MRVLHAATEAFPYLKVGGLSDVLGALPPELARLGLDVSLLLPGYPRVLAGVGVTRELRRWERLPGEAPGRLLAGEARRGVTPLVLDLPSLYSRYDDPYDDRGDAHVRAAALSWVAAELACAEDGSAPDVLHCHDWHTALAPAYLRLVRGSARAARTVLTVHNLAYQGEYPEEELARLWLPRTAFDVAALEFWGRLDLLKGGLVFADRVTTVSPSYAAEIRSAGGGFGLDGVLRARGDALCGILNGVDTAVWSPETSPHLAAPFSAADPAPRRACKAALGAEVGLDLGGDPPVFAVVSRLAELKGSDLVVANVEHLVSLGARLVVLGRGDPAIEGALLAAASAHPGRVAVRIAHDEGLAHRIFAGADAVLVPSRSEPCGLVQMYAMRYGALPVARHTGGLADTVVDVTLGDEATGFTFDAADGWSLGATLIRAVLCYRGDAERWRQLQRRGMTRDFGWAASAERYRALYAELVAGR